MSTKTVLGCAVVLAALHAGAALAQERVIPAPAPYPAPAATGDLAAPMTTVITDPAHPVPSAYITYRSPGCCGHVGAEGPIQGELYVRTGPAVHVGGGFLDHQVDDGWFTSLGGRALFFDPAEIRAFTVDLSLAYIYNNGKGNSPPFTLLDGSSATVRALHRTEGTLTLGHEYYLIGNADSCGRRWRAGWDAGARWGTTRLDLNNPDQANFKRLNSWNWGPVAAIHTDVEIPCGCCKWIVGVRAEWDDTFSNRLAVPAHDHDLSDINLLLNVGIHY
jgi:hypothetical protein